MRRAIISPCTGSSKLWDNYIVQCLVVSKPRPSATCSPPTAVACVLTVQPWPIRQKRISASQTEQHTTHHCEPTMARGFQHWTALHMAYRYRRIDIIWYGMEKTREYAFVCAHVPCNKHYGQKKLDIVCKQIKWCMLWDLFKKFPFQIHFCLYIFISNVKLKFYISGSDVHFRLKRFPFKMAKQARSVNPNIISKSCT